MSIKTIHNNGRETPDSVLGRFRTGYPEYFLVYREFWSILDRVAARSLQTFTANEQARLTASVHATDIDEFNQAERIAAIASRYRKVGHLDGVVTNMLVAEHFASFCRFSTPLIWCELAENYISIPFLRETKRCLENATCSLDNACQTDEAILPGDTTGRWIPEYGLEFYKARIQEATKRSEEAPHEPVFCLKDTMEVLEIRNESILQILQRDLEHWRDGFKPQGGIMPRVI